MTDNIHLINVTITKEFTDLSEKFTFSPEATKKIRDVIFDELGKLVHDNVGRVFLEVELMSEIPTSEYLTDTDSLQTTGSHDTSWLKGLMTENTQESEK